MLAASALSLGFSAPAEQFINSKEAIASLNADGATWVAGENEFFAGKTYADAKKLLGTQFPSEVELAALHAESDLSHLDAVKDVPACRVSSRSRAAATSAGSRSAGRPTRGCRRSEASSSWVASSSARLKKLSWLQRRLRPERRLERRRRKIVLHAEGGLMARGRARPPANSRALAPPRTASSSGVPRAGARERRRHIRGAPALGDAQRGAVRSLEKRRTVRVGARPQSAAPPRG